MPGPSDLPRPPSPAEPDGEAAASAADLRARLMGLGELSTCKSYYPELKRRIAEQDRFRALLDQSSDVILLVDGASGRVVDVTGSPGMLGIGRERLVGRHMDELLTVGGGSRLRRALVRGGGRVPLDCDKARLVVDGRSAPLLEANVSVVASAGQKYAVIALRDVTFQVEAREEVERAKADLERRVAERTRELTAANLMLRDAVEMHKAAEERYRMAKEQAEDANRAKSEFLSVVSHELRTPLTAVRGFAQIIAKQLERDAFPLLPEGDPRVGRAMEHTRENLQIIDLESRRLTGLINDLLDFSKLESGHVEFARVPVEVGRVLERAAQATESLFREAGVPLRLAVAPDLPPVSGDADRLMQVMVNLLSNAVKFTAAGEVRCEAWAGRGHVLVVVADSGPGIPEELQERIFEKFVQAGDPLTGRPKGTGLGLAISRQIVERHGGHIWVESRLGEGSSFCFLLPATQGKTANGRPPSRSEP